MELRLLPSNVLEFLARQEPGKAQWRKLFPVFTGAALPDASSEKLPMLGTYSVDSAAIQFQPRFAFEPGMTYTAGFHSNRLKEFWPEQVFPDFSVADFSFQVEERGSAPATRILEVFPSTGTPPVNLLKFYVYFSAPMAQHNPHDFVHLYDEDGTEVNLPFVEVKEGLWDQDRRRLTLFFHPGRIKRGVGLNVALGMALAENHSYRLVIDRDIRDAFGRPLAAAFEKEFQTRSADRASPEFETWKIILPAAGTVEPLRVVFDEPLDQALVLRLLTVYDAGGKRVEGAATVHHGEKEWHLRPERPWAPGRYALEASSVLEDLAGNRLDQLFETTVSDRKAAPTNLTKTFTVAPAGAGS